MRRVRYSVAMSLDGYIADPQGGYGMPGQKAYVFSKTLEQADCPDATVSDDPDRHSAAQLSRQVRSEQGGEPRGPGLTFCGYLPRDRYKESL